MEELKNAFFAYNVHWDLKFHAEEIESLLNREIEVTVRKSGRGLKLRNNSTRKLLAKVSSRICESASDWEFVEEVENHVSEKRASVLKKLMRSMNVRFERLVFTPQVENAYAPQGL